jgi:hypothetical protein
MNIMNILVEAGPDNGWTVLHPSRYLLLALSRHKLVDYCLGQNAECYRDAEPFLSRNILGLSKDWSRVKSWVEPQVHQLQPSPSQHSAKEEKISRDPKLVKYYVPPYRSFWNFFQKNKLPETPKTCMDISVLKLKISKLKHNLTWAQMQRAKKCIDSLERGRSSDQKKPLPPCFQRNAPSMVTFGEAVVDTVPIWIKSQFVSGPFVQPPLPNFRLNPFDGCRPGEKVRIVLDVSLPKGLLFNDNIEQESVETITMLSAHKVSYVIHDGGKNANVSNIDNKDACKIIPAPIEDLRLQGFHSLGKYLVETQ